MPAKRKDEFDQIMWFGTTLSAANTLTFSEIVISSSIFEYAALVVSRVEYVPEVSVIGEMTANNDYVMAALTGDNTLTSLSIQQPEVYDMAFYGMRLGAAGDGLYDGPLVHDFSTMPGGGLIIPAQSIYLGVVSGGLASAATVSCRMYYHVKDLVAAEYLELVQRLRVLSSS